MTKQELFESEYILNDAEYIKFCKDDVEVYFLQKELDNYDRDCWLFERPVNYNLEDDYTEESMP